MTAMTALLRNLCFVFFTLISMTARAAEVPAQTTAQEKVASATLNNLEPMQKEALAKKLIEVSGASSLIQTNLRNAENYLNRPANGKNEKETVALKTAAQNSLLELSRKKQKLIADANKELVVELIKIFTAQELQYLIDINNYKTFKKYQSFLESDIYYDISGKSLKTAREILSEQKTKLLK